MSLGILARQSLSWRGAGSWRGSEISDSESWERVISVSESWIHKEIASYLALKLSERANIGESKVQTSTKYIQNHYHYKDHFMIIKLNSGA